MYESPRFIATCIFLNFCVESITFFLCIHFNESAVKLKTPLFKKVIFMYI